MESVLESLLAPYQRAISGQEMDRKDPLYSMLFETPQVRAAAGQKGLPGVNDSSDVVALGKRLAAKFGWTGDQWKALYQLWSNESGWNPNADNPTSSALGIPQALTSMHDVGDAYLSGDPRAQIKWGLNYIQGRYGSPLDALEFWESNSPHWY